MTLTPNRKRKLTRTLHRIGNFRAAFVQFAFLSRWVRNCRDASPSPSPGEVAERIAEHAETGSTTSGSGMGSGAGSGVAPAMPGEMGPEQGQRRSSMAWTAEAPTQAEVPELPNWEAWQQGMVASGGCFGVWQTSLGRALLHVWYNADPVVVEEVEYFDNPCGRLVASEGFNFGINAAIMANLVVMSLPYEGQSDGYGQVIDHIESVFGLIFIIEMLLKWYGFGGLKWYFQDWYNNFDFLLVAVSIPSLVSTLSGQGGGVNLSFFRVFRMFRILRAFRVLRQLHEIIQVVTQATKAIVNLCIFIFFSIIITAIFMLQLCAGKMGQAELGGGAAPCKFRHLSGRSTLALPGHDRGGLDGYPV